MNPNSGRAWGQRLDLTAAYRGPTGMLLAGLADEVFRPPADEFDQRPAGNWMALGQFGWLLRSATCLASVSVRCYRPPTWTKR